MGVGMPEPIVSPVEGFYEMGLEDDESFQVTVSVRDQLDALLRNGNFGPQAEALCQAIMTTVASLELRLLESRGQLTGLQAQMIEELTTLESRLTALQVDTMNVHSQLFNLETRIYRSGVHLEPGDGSSRASWEPEDD
ncbi:hypothetical protein A7R75_02845 [Mycolicibacterium llatzerense]|nr:hypothetical protein [Mycolicibacterium llatzerense]